MKRKRKTIIYAIRDEENKKFIVRNRNTDNFNKKFQDIFYNLCTLEGETLDHIAILSRLNDFINDDNWIFYHIFDAENIYNRDQKEINRRKDHYTNEFIMNGYIEDPSLDNDGTNINYNDKAIQSAINLRNIITLYNEKAEEAKKHYESQCQEWDEKTEEALINKRKHLRVELDKLQKEFNNEKTKLEKKYNDREKELQQRINDLQTEFEDIVNLRNKKIELETSIKNLNDIMNQKKNENEQVKFLTKEYELLNYKTNNLNKEYKEVQHRLIDLYTLKHSDTSEELISQAIDNIINKK